MTLLWIVLSDTSEHKALFLHKSEQWSFLKGIGLSVKVELILLFFGHEYLVLIALFFFTFRACFKTLSLLEIIHC